MVISKTSSKYNIFARKLQLMHTPFNEYEVDVKDIQNKSSQLPQERARILVLTSSSAATSNIFNTNKSKAFDTTDSVELKWEETSQETSKIQLEQLHQQRHHKEITTSSANDWRKRIKKLRFLKRTIELARRKSFDKKGSFAVNMMTYRDHKKGDSNAFVKGDDGLTSNCPKSSSINGIGYDDRSGSSASTYVSNDSTLQVINEDISYFDT
mmetsp:Transcript_9779/g.23886  ORF Transcript_9779/g.23886 Transcript_9779/m.23886 type:complete len:211 (+) Transcript_9779:175-807(+)|eukprot:CAMPEP_0197194900 /NCGR_PEP_ID=MMETSP1423-20130617/30100_1 /TAXON_ID=476441 /ORGANISM="Pseudo-nitzschia heimii, Strain UNC1101" /LENGTH=210 /DNA_ID=CAMNT_0042648409 /DNA_START=126 /DNA_END=758 /DNA_ORIENTATION=+